VLNFEELKSLLLSILKNNISSQSNIDANSLKKYESLNKIIRYDSVD
jgi:hypothetical protein